MSTFITRKNLKIVSPTPTGAGGIAHNDNFTVIGDTFETHAAAIEQVANDLGQFTDHIDELVLSHVEGAGLENLSINNLTITTLVGLTAADVPSLPESKVTNLVTDLAAKAPTTRTISTSAPLTGGGDLSADRTLAISAASGSAAGSMSAAHFSLVNGATNLLTANAIVKRDVSGNIAVNGLTTGAISANNTISTTQTITATGNITSSASVIANGISGFSGKKISLAPTTGAAITIDTTFGGSSIFNSTGGVFDVANDGSVTLNQISNLDSTWFVHTDGAASFVSLELDGPLTLNGNIYAGTAINIDGPSGAINIGGGNLILSQAGRISITQTDAYAMDFSSVASISFSDSLSFCDSSDGAPRLIASISGMSVPLTATIGNTTTKELHVQNTLVADVADSGTISYEETGSTFYESDGIEHTLRVYGYKQYGPVKVISAGYSEYDVIVDHPVGKYGIQWSWEGNGAYDGYVVRKFDIQTHESFDNWGIDVGNALSFVDDETTEWANPSYPESVETNFHVTDYGWVKNFSGTPTYPFEIKNSKTGDRMFFINEENQIIGIGGWSASPLTVDDVGQVSCGNLNAQTGFFAQEVTCSSWIGTNLYFQCALTSGGLGDPIRGAIKFNDDDGHFYGSDGTDWNQLDN